MRPCSEPASNARNGPEGVSDHWTSWGNDCAMALQPHDKCTQFDTDGTPSLSVRNSIYQPGGAAERSFGIFALSVSGGATVKGTSTSRCVLLKECVVSPGLTKLIHLICCA